MPKLSPLMSGKSTLAERTSEKIRDWCTKNGFTDATNAAKFLGIPQPTFHNYYVGRRLPRLDHLETIARKLGGNLNEIFSDIAKENEKTRKWMIQLKAFFKANPKEQQNVLIFIHGLWKDAETQNNIIEWLRE